MVEGNHAETAGPTSIAHQHQQQHQTMTSVPPPTGNHPRYDRPGGGPSMGYGGGPPPPHGSYGNAFSSYPPPYGNSMHGNYGGGPPPQGPPLGYPRGSYPHYGSGYGPGAGPGGYSPPGHPPPPYPYGGYEGHYGQPPPGHLPHPSGSYRGASPVPPPSSSAAAPPAVPSGSPSPSTEPNSSPNKGNDTTTPGIKQEPGAKLPGSSPQQQQHSQSSPPSESRPSPTASDHGEVERLRAAAATEITTEEVKPIQTDFHFFVKEHVEEFRKLAQDEVRKSLQTDGGENTSEEEQLDPMLVNSNLNSRLMRAWESLTKKHRDSYMVQEEADRRRFMEDDEIASRHCATLTARGKSQTAIVTGSIVTATPQQRLKPQEKKETQPGDDKVPPPKTVEAKTENDGEEKKAEEPSKDDDAVKRPVPESSTSSDISDGTKSEVHESPTKKNKVAL